MMPSRFSAPTLRSRPISPEGESTAGYHADFDSPDGDFILQARGVRFRTHKLLLGLSSPLLQEALSLPNQKEELMELDEDPNTFVDILRIISLRPMPAIETLERVETLAYFAKKYYMDNVLAVIQSQMSRITTTSETNCLQAYRIARRFNWAAEAKAASTRTLSLDLNDPKYNSYLASMETSDILALQTLRQDRTNRLAQFLADTGKVGPLRDALFPQSACLSHRERSSLSDMTKRIQDFWDMASTQILLAFSARSDTEAITTWRVNTSWTLRKGLFPACYDPSCSQERDVDRDLSRVQDAIVKAIKELPDTV